MELNAPENDSVSAAGENSAKKGRRLAPGGGGGKWKLPVLIIAVVMAVLAVACVMVYALAWSSDFLPNVYVGDVDVGGKSVEEARRLLEDDLRNSYDTLEIPIRVGEHTVTFQAKEAKVIANVDLALDRARLEGKEDFFAAGPNLVAAWFGKRWEVPWPVVVDDPIYVDSVLARASGSVDRPVAETSWTLEETEETAALALTKGTTGQTVDVDDLRRQLMEALSNRESGAIDAKIVTTSPQEPDFDKMAAEVDREPMDAALDVETDEVIPHRLGVKLDPAKAKAVYETLAEGESGTVELEVTQPDVTTLDLRSTLFRDILGEGTSKVTGDAARVNNVRLSAAACDGVVLLPGQQMSYNQTTGQRTTAKGYREATGYTSKGQEMMVGGGVCQPSSTLYMACLHANLEIVNRKNHMYTVSYMPEGVDATVSWPNLDYVFANNTKYPIKISMTIENKVLTARIYGTKTDDNYAKLESVRLSTTPAGVSYQADPAVARGTTKVVQGAHTGKKVEVYKNTYTADGTLISREWVSTDTYRPSDKIIAYNPLDGVPEAGIAPLPDPDVPPVDPAGPTVVPEAPTVMPTQPPVATPEPPVATPEPSATQLPQPEPPVAPSVEPEATPTPAPTSPPVDISLLPPAGVPTE